jgi:Flp pilus assembly pilin Flp
MKNLFNRFVREEAGQDIIEYALLAAFVSIVAWALLANIGTSVNSIYTKVNSVAATAQSKIP